MTNSVRDEMKDELRSALCVTNLSDDEINELTPELADVVFDVLGITPERQDMEYDPGISFS